MKTCNFMIFFLLCSYALQAQETFLSNSFSVRDIIVQKDSVFLIEKRDVKYFNYNIENSPVHSYFIGGYGLGIYNDSINNELITVSNEFHRTVSSLRFYNKSSKKVEEVYYYHKGKSIDALIIPELKYAVMSLNNNKIIIVDYTKKPSFKLFDEIQLKGMSRRLIYEKGFLFYFTDLGEMYKYNLKTKENILLYACGKRITDFVMFNGFIVYSTDDGEIIKRNSLTGNTNKIMINDNLVINLLHFDFNKLICGTFKGEIIIINTDDMSILKRLNFHKQSVIKIINSKQNEFYSSSIDKTIKKWKLNQ